MQEHNPFAKENWQNKNFIRQLNRERIEQSKRLVLKIVKFLFDRPLKAFRQDQKFDPSQIKKILIFHFDDKIGDMVINSILFRELKKLGPQISIDIVTGKNSFDLIDGHPLLHKIFVFKKGFLRTLYFAAKFKAEKYDLVVDPRIMTDARTIYILSQIQPKWIIGFHKQKFQIYSDSINEDYNQIHTTEKMRAILQKLGVKDIDLRYELQPQSPAIEFYKQAAKKYSLNQFLILNLYAGARFRSFRTDTGAAIIKRIRDLRIRLPIVLVGPPNKASEIHDLIASLPEQDLLCLPEQQTISELTELIRHAKLVITPDTSLVHIASAFNIPLITVFCKDSDGVEKNSKQWAPKSDFSKVIIATGRTDGEVDVNTLPLEELNQALSAAQRSL